MDRRVPTWLLAFGLGVALLASAASARPNNESGGTLRLLWGREPDSLDPAIANGDVGSWLLLSATCATLFTTVSDPDTGKPRVVGEVVRSFARSNVGRTYTFELKRTFRFHTGERVTARSFVRAFNRDALIKIPTRSREIHSGVVTRGFIQDIVGAIAVIRGRAKRISGVQALGRYRLRIRLKRAARDFPARLTMPYFCPISAGTPNRPIDEPAGSGPYWLADRAPNRRIILERNPYYRGGRTANPDHIVWTIQNDSRARLRAMERGEHDFLLVFDYPDTVVRDLVADYGPLNRPGGQVLRPSFSNFKLSFTFNEQRRAFKGAGQAPLKKAINYVIDRPALARARAGPLAFLRSDRLLPEALSDSRRLYPLGGTDPVMAERWLARTRWKPPKLHLYTTSFAFHVKTAEVFIYNMRQLGIEVEPHYFEFLELQERLITPGEPWDVSTGGGIGSGTAAYPDPAATFLPDLRGTRWEARVNAANGVASETARAKAWADLEADLMSTDPPVAAYADWRPLYFVSRNFGCWGAGLGDVCKK